MDTLFFIGAKLVGLAIRPETWIVLALCLTLVAMLRGWMRSARATLGGSLALLVLLAVLPVGDLLLRPLETQFPPAPVLERVDGIVVLGGAEDARKTSLWGQTQLNESAERLTSAVVLARRYPQARILFAGGSGALRDVAGSAYSEAAVARQFFIDQGLPSSRLLFESRSRNTAENARHSFELAAPGVDETWVLITSAFHMPRAMRSFEAAGWPEIVAYPVDYRTGRFADGIGWDLPRNLALVNTAIKEYAGLIAYRITGR
ncbi:MAG: YdcF family protein [Parvibaculum sp.]|uniref:YdcF family protein n=1 Tax=Parvibaculum sp. TaxID=2024848 RepID=UPI00271DBA6F|nr:YdcF family protein [Parvibaculum sp.]MDO8838153.1 YdcF family protein [Parvibaculum sp.]